MLLEAMFFTDNISIKALADEFGANGIRDIKFILLKMVIMLTGILKKQLMDMKKIQFMLEN
ncbi:16222_t:CDS:1, partial [Entrophospora sp. SA101]